MTTRKSTPRPAAAKAGKSRRKVPAARQPLPGTWIPAYVVVIGMTPQMRERHPEWPLSLWEALELGRDRSATTAPQPDPEPEAEP